MSVTVKFTAGRVNSYQCEQGKYQSILWDSSAPGLGLRVTSNGARAYIFQSKLNNTTLRITIGQPSVWDIAAAQAEVRRLKVLVDSGIDPRKVKADAVNLAKQEHVAKEALAVSQSVTLIMVWDVYIAERLSQWGERHLQDHRKLMQAGGESRKKSDGLTKPGPLAALAHVRLIDLSAERINEWAQQEGQTRATSARLALRLLKACLGWCAVHPIYSSIIQADAAKGKKIRESLGKPKVKNDVLQREQLAVWFAAVQQTSNPVISAYLQTLMLTGARREEMMQLKWIDVDFQWSSMTIRDKIEGERIIPLTPYVAQLLRSLPRRNEWVFSSANAAGGRLTEPRIAHNKALAIAGLPHLSIHGLRRSFASLCEWVEMPSGISAQIQGHAPQGVREQNYIRRPLDLLRMWHTKIEAWILEQAGVEFVKCEKLLKAIS